MTIWQISIFSICVIVGFVLLILGADYFVEGASHLAMRFSISQLVIGLTVVAIGTSMPETAVSITAALSGNMDISVGNVVGSNILNVLLILGICGLLQSSKRNNNYSELLLLDIPIMILVSVLLTLMGDNQQLSRLEGFVMIICYGIYIVSLFCRTKLVNNNEQNDLVENNPDMVTAKELQWGNIFLFLFGGLAALILGSRLVVYGAEGIAIGFGVSQRVIGLTIVAFGTSLPELITSIAATKKNNDDIAIGNIIGSNIYNILGILGVTSLILPVNYTIFGVDSYVMIGSGLLLWIVMLPKKSLTRVGGIVMLAGYIGYLIYLF